MATHLHKHIRGITRKAFERYGFAYGDIIRHWREIAGEEFAAYSAPERIRWPRQRLDDAAASRRKLGGTLVIRVTDGRAVELQHEASRIIDRVNTYYGYEAVTRLAIVHGPLPQEKRRAKPPAELDTQQRQALEDELVSIENDRLRDALMRLGTGALARKSAKQGH